MSTFSSRSTSLTSTSLTSLSSLLARPGTRTTVRSFARCSTRPGTDPPCAMVEALEDRQFFSAAPLLAAPAAAAAGKALPAVSVDKLAGKLVKNVDKFADKLAKHPDKVVGNGVTTLIPLKIDAIKLVNGALTAVGSLAGQPFSLPITLDTEENPAGADECPILDLALGPINLDVLGLNVDTSKICLNITAEEGPGNLLGNLLCDVSHLLDGGTSIGDILGDLTGAQLNRLLTGLTDLLNGALGHILSPASLLGAGAGPAAAPGVTDILNLSVGPVDLNLLGLDVELDDCEGGPVTVDVTAESGPGKLLGNLLGGIAGLLDNPANPGALGNLLGRVSKLIGGLLR
jgi:hypothetical protein